jgi:asparagine synthase (glutamine-hydrolysing)
VEEVFSWPDNIRSDGQTLKHIFKKALIGTLPDNILNKKKQGFSIPWKSWIKNWDEFHALKGDGRFFRRDLPLPAHYMPLMTQLWLNDKA